MGDVGVCPMGQDMLRWAAPLIVLLLAGCARPALPTCDIRGDYSYEGLDGYNHTIIKLPYDVAVLPHVSQCEQHGRFIIGLRSKPETLTDPRFFDDPFGWFVIDTSKSQVTFGLNESEARQLIDTGASKERNVLWRKIGPRLIPNRKGD